MKYSFIIPVYNRPDEVDELLDSLTRQTFRDFEVVVVEDGSVVPCCMDSEGAITLGNVFSQPLEEILESPRAKALYEGFSCRKATEELCRRCGYARRFG